MEKLGFETKWISLISSCIRSVSFSILVNGEPHSHFTPKRGLRQGEPLSPYLFLLSAEGLHSLIQQAELSGSIKGVSLCSTVPKVSHLFFANDSFPFVEQPHMNATPSLIYCTNMKRHRDKKSTKAKPNYFSAPTPPIICSKK